MLRDLNVIQVERVLREEQSRATLSAGCRP